MPGILRGYICRVCEAEEREILPEEVRECEEMFLTNSLLGVMPVTSFGQYQFPSQKKGRELLRKYREERF